jgi:NADP-dependent 3-hydroxy acid dehydrogenase YdfG
MAVATGLLARKVAMISGVGDGLGKQTALAFAEHGASIALGARTAARIEAIATEIRGSGGEAIAVCGDITDDNYCTRFVDTAVDAFGRVDCLVNNAARGPFFPDTFAPCRTRTSPAGGTPSTSTCSGRSH